MDSQTFKNDMKQCDVNSRTHIIYDQTQVPEAAACDHLLKHIDDVFGAADVMSIENAEKHRRVLWAMAAVATVVTISFLLYDEAELHGLIFACGAMLLGTFAIRRTADRLDCHKKYLEYRVLAESLRVQYFLIMAGIHENVRKFFPWPLQMSVPWVVDILTETAPKSEIDNDHVKMSVLDHWIRDQRYYHEKALKKAQARDVVNNRITTSAFVLTIAAYFVTLLFEIYIFRTGGNGVIGITFDEAQVIRAILKIVLGSLSAATLFTGNYYGKMSLPSTINDHKRMAALFRVAEERIIVEGETETLLRNLAREAIGENSNWYAYQSMNSAEISI